MLEDENQTELVNLNHSSVNLNKILLHEGWFFRQEGTDNWLMAQIPGCNFTDLLNNGIITDPFFGADEDKLQWIENENWEYKCVFSIDEELSSSTEIELVFEGLDTYCEVILNGVRLLDTDNMFVEHRVLCKQYLRCTQNELLLKFRSPILETKDSQKKLGITYPAENDKSDNKLSVFTRKAPYHYGWDWGPRFVTSGIWRPVYLEEINLGKISNTHVSQHWLSENEVRLDFEVEITALAHLEGSLVINCDEIPERIVESVSLQSEIGKKTLSLTILNPQRWWPNGTGEAHLYKFNINLLVGQILVNKVEERIGLRTIEVINEPDEHGESFYLKVNGHPVFMKGANHIPADSFLPSVTREKYRQIFEDVRDANMNMLRVWGGGTYEDDFFYELADEYGILIWQDFMFACSLYPASDEFIKNVKREAIFNIKRLRNHACLALWCGNNEVEMGIEFWDWKAKFNYSNEEYEELKKDYHLLFRQLLPELVDQFDPSRFYFSSSPIGFWEIESDDNRGDNHYWGVWHGEEDFDAYKKRVPRFMSEYGFQSFPLQESMDKYIAKEDQCIDSEAMKVHQKHPRGNRIINETILKYYKEPKDFESFLYLSQLIQAEGLKIAFEAHRSAMPFCMGSLYWQLNDCWPVASWSGIDYYGQWKALHYQAKRSFAKYLVLQEEKDGIFSVALVSDSLVMEEGVLTVEVMSKEGNIVLEKQLPLTLNPNAVEQVFEEELKNIPAPHFCYVVTLVVNGKQESKNILYKEKVKDIELPKPDINYNISQKNKTILLDLTSTTFVRNLYVTFEGAKGNFSENFFDLIPGNSVVIHYELQDEETIGELSFFSVYDTYKS